ncbi:type II toxin-antitoxin system VapC family toxin [Candidatus Albibeggiatoa sp. nov. NOAA]|uniref:PIN domain-containing protein n=1 Tax=Candidatus Albibeggiatoa sp. nov. NOAA TaxID=3162724 RepID=UPI00330411B7|nr:type II toxin-antitoxin system VapC family toxin [Thiotrichaceae bacterium]
MNAIDTNILARFLMNDDDVQAQKVHQLFKQAEVQHTTLFIPMLVVIELIWVLESAYKIERTNILDAIHDLTHMPTLTFENLPALKNFIITARTSNFDLSDLLIAYSAQTQGYDKVITFDKKASKFELFESVTHCLNQD